MGREEGTHSETRVRSGSYLNLKWGLRDDVSGSQILDLQCVRSHLMALSI